MNDKKPRRIIIPAVVGYRKGKDITFFYESEHSFFNWLSRMSDDNPDHKRAEDA